MALVLSIKQDKKLSIPAMRAMTQERIRAMQNWRSPLKTIAMVLYKGVMENFRTQGARLPTGRWKALSPVTIARRTGGGKGSPRILQDKGTLRQSIFPGANDTTAFVATNLIQAPTLHFGRPAMTVNVPAHSYDRVFGRGKNQHTTTIKVKAHSQRVPRIPARPFIAINEDDRKRVLKTGLDVLRGKYVS